nr:uncharacterized protein LOC128687309 isoform X2 [Cherax quadricarinatus]
MVVFYLLLYTWVLRNTHAATLESINTGPLFVVHVLKGGRAEMPCDVVTADSSDRVVLVLWYKDGVGAPVYSYDSRKHSLLDARNWADGKTLSGRGHFDLQSSPASLILDNVRATDEGLYRCRVDFKKSPTRNARTHLTVISKPPPRVTWWTNGEMIDDTDESPRAHTVTNTLTLARLTRAHLHTIIVCRASNSNHTAPVQTSVTIEMNCECHSLLLKLISGINIMLIRASCRLSGVRHTRTVLISWIM